MLHVMDDATFSTYVYNVARKCAPYSPIEFFNGSLFIAGCTPREASRMQNAFECEGVGVIVTPGTYEYSFDFV